MRQPSNSVPASSSSSSDRRTPGDGSNRGGISNSDGNIGGGKARRRDGPPSAAGVAAASGTTASKEMVGASNSWSGNTKKTNGGTGQFGSGVSLPRPSAVAARAAPARHAARSTTEKQQQQKQPVSRPTNEMQKQPTKQSTKQPNQPPLKKPQADQRPLPTQQNADGNNASASDIEVGFGGWLDGIGNLMGLRPPAVIDVSQPSLVSGDPGAPRPLLPPPPPPPRVPPPAAAAAAIKTGAIKSGASDKADGSPRTTTQPPPSSRGSSMSRRSRSSSRTPPVEKSDRKHEKKTEKAKPTSGTGSARSEEKKDRQASSTTRLSGKPSNGLPKKTPTSAADSSKGLSGQTKGSPPSSGSSSKTPSSKATTPSHKATLPFTGTKAPSIATKTSKPLSSSSSPGPIKLISSFRPTLATIPSPPAARRTTGTSHPNNDLPLTAGIGGSGKAGNPGKRRRRRVRQISGELNEVLAVLERGVKLADDDDGDDYDDEEEDAISIKETFLEGIKSWKAFLRLPPPAMAVGAASRSGRPEPTERRDDERRRRRRERDEGQNRTSSTKSRSTALADDSGGDRCSGKKKEGLELAMNVTGPRASTPSSKQRQSSLDPSSSSKRTSSKDDRRKRSSSPSKRKDVHVASAPKGADVDLEAGLGKPPMAPSPSKRRPDTKKSAVTNRSRSSGRSRSTPPAPSNAKFFRGTSSNRTALPQKPIKNASPARSTESSRTALTAKTEQSYDGSPHARRSSSLSTRRGVILDERDALQAGSGSGGRLESTGTSPTLIGDKKPSPPPPTDEEVKKQKQQARDEFYENNFAIFAHGRWSTIIPILCALAANILGLVSQQTSNFAFFREPMLVAPTFEPVDRIGLLYVDLCLADEFTTVAEGSGIKTVVEKDWSVRVRLISAPGGEGNGMIGNLLTWASPPSIEEFDQVVEDYDHDDYIFVGPSDDEFETDLAGWGEETKDGADTPPKICRTVKITSSLLNDPLWHLSRSSVCLALICGVFFFFFLCSATYWSTINLKPVMFGLFFTYVFQSLTFFYFSSLTCDRYYCGVSAGAAAGIASSLLWLGALMGTCWMDWVFLAKKKRKLERERRLRRRERRARRKREAKAAFEAAMKKAEALASSSDAAPVVSVEVELLDDTCHSCGLESEISHVSYLGDGEDEWLENGAVDVVYDDYEWEEEGGLEVEAQRSASSGGGADVISSWWW